uniref:Kinase, PIK n=1 Tax=Trepomonas sp. PC1 TaxID=1076344 RepID=A0A146KLE8_9EUKA|eukprot:JAP96019.1 Kinase, PIK [Trepomonas sp. PC1]
MIEYAEFIDVFQILQRYQTEMFKEIIRKMPNLQNQLQPHQVLSTLYAQNAKQNKWPSSQIQQLLQHQYLQQEMYQNYTQYSQFLMSLALNSMFQAVCGLNDRHLENITILQNQVLNIDVEKSFFQGLLGSQPELVPFRMTKLFQMCFSSKQQIVWLIQIVQKLIFNEEIKKMIEENFQNQALRDYMFRVMEDEEQILSLVEMATNLQILDKMWCGFMAWM